jgi:hypothetical protein
VLIALLLTMFALPAQATAVPKSPCGEGGYYGGGDEIPPGGPNFYGALLVTVQSDTPASVDRNGDGWVCRTTSGYTDTARIASWPGSEVIRLGDMMGPPIDEGMCCNGDLFKDARRNLFHAAGTTGSGTRFDSRRAFVYDGNDIFYLDGQRVSLRTFETRINEGFLFFATLAPANRTSVWSVYRHEV